ncbi:MAG: MBL fold metallo-hydrolase [Myxococcales bacterium]|nr:MBL fold metallo-hydrolase [Myxococcales bacterium]
MQPFQDAFRELGLDGRLDVLPIPSGYPSPKHVNLILRRHAGTTYLFECGPARPDVIEETRRALEAHGVRKLDALLVTHCHGDHAGSAGIVAGHGRPEGERAPVYLHSAGYRFLTHPEAAFLNETYEIFQTRAHWGLHEYNAFSDEQMLNNALRKRFSGYFARTPKGALSFVDAGKLPPGMLALETPGHSLDCVLYYDTELQIAVPGDTIICTGLVDKPETHGYVIPIFTVAGQSYSVAYERFLESIRVLREFFRTYSVRAVLAPHGKFAVTRPLEWVEFAEGYFRGIYRALLDDFFGEAERRNKPFRACDLNAFVPSAGSHPISTPSHTFGMLCTLADEGFLSLEEHPHTRQITFTLEALPPADYVERRLAEPVSRLPIFGGPS